jgi:hypothetical protein
MTRALELTLLSLALLVATLDFPHQEGRHLADEATIILQLKDVVRYAVRQVRERS